MKSILVVVLAASSGAQSFAQVALTPGTPALTASPVFVQGSPAIATATPNAGAVNTNATLGALSDSLLVLQNNLVQTLPLLATFNDSFDFVSLGDNGQGASAAASAPGNFSANLGTNFATNLGVNAAMPTGGSLFNTAPVRTVPAAAGLPPGTATIPVTRDTLRALLVLQADLQRLLPVLNGLNAGTANFPGSFTNLFGLVPASP